MSMKFGYARVSTTDQDHQTQIEALERAGCGIIRAEKISGTSRAGRTELETVLQFLRAGDTLVVTRIDRLARSLRDLQNIVWELREKGAYLCVTEQAVDTETPAGKAFLDMLGVFAEFETNLRKERQMEGIKKAKERGVYKGRLMRLSDKQRRTLLEAYNAGGKPSELARQFKVHRTTLYRALAKEGVTFVKEDVADEGALQST